MPFSYADAIKRPHGEKPSQKTASNNKKDAHSSTYGKLHVENTVGIAGSSGFHGNPNQEGSIQKHIRAKQSKVGGNAPVSKTTWRNIAGRTETTSEQSSVPYTNERRAKRKDFNGNASGKPQKSSKPKPSLRSVSISDLIAPTASTKGRKGSVDRVAVPSKSSESETKPVVKFPVHSLPNRKGRVPDLKWRAPERRTTVKGRNQAIHGVKSQKAVNKKQTKKHASNSDPTSPLAAMFLQPRGHDSRSQDGEEHQLLRLMQERTVYKKKGRQRVAPRKKKLTALKKKVLQERLNKWQERHPVQANSCGEVNSNHPSDIPHSRGFQSICLYHFVSSADLEDDDEFEEVKNNLLEMATKVAEVDKILVPQGLDRCGKYPVFVRFKTVEGAIAAKACWEGLVIAGDVLEVVFIDDSSLNENSDWSGEMITAEGKGAFPQMHNTRKPDNRTTTIVIEGVLSQDDYDESDCMEESLSFLKQAVAKYADVSMVRPSNERNGNALLFCNGDSATADTVVRGLSSTVIAGRALSARVLETTGQTLDAMSLSYYIVLENLLTQDDFDDKECMDETLSDVKELIEKFGSVVDIRTDGSVLQIYFMGNVSAAQGAVVEMNGLVLGGRAVSARMEKINERSFFLRNALSEDDMDDNDCLEESLNDIRQLMSKYGEISRLNAIRDRNVVVVNFVPSTIKPTMTSVVDALNGSVIGGRIISASSSLVQSPTASETLVANKPTPPVAVQGGPEAKKPIYSGDKLIPEFFAECKRVPKIPNSSGPRNYAQVTNDELIRPLLTGMLGELMRLQKRAIEDKNAKARRRLVMGLREVCRGIRAHKVKMVVMANNLDEYGAIDEKLQEIIDLARTESIPLFFEFTKRSLGRALGKTIKVAVVGIQNADGAHREFKELCAIHQRYHHQ